jgi:predicted transcriptional regulator
MESLRRRRVSEIMREEVVTLAANETLDLTQDVMNLGRVRHMPVLDGDRLVGIVSRRDVLEASLSRALDFDAASRRSFLRSVEVGEVMAKELVTVDPDTTLADAARLLVRRKIGCLPVVDPDGRLLGLVTETDLLSAAYLDDVEEDAAIEVSMKKDLPDWIESEIDDLRRIRDELRVQAHLAKAEVRDRWDTLEHGLQSLERRVKQTSRAAEEPLRRLEADVRQLASDLRDGFRRIKDSL